MIEADVSLPDGVTIAYAMFGRRHRGTPLLLLRPLGGSVHLWGSFLDRLAERRRVIAFDPRGVGRSSAAHVRTNTTRHMAADARAVLDALGVARAHVFGLSLGGMVATWLAIDAPKWVGRLVLASTPPFGLAISLGQSAGFFRCLAMPDARACASCLVRAVLSPTFRRTRRSEVARIDRIVRAEPSTKRSLLALLRAAATHAPGEALSSIRARTLVLAARDDRLVSLSSARALASAIPNARLETIARSGHDLSLERPEETAKRVLAFLSRGDR